MKDSTTRNEDQSESAALLQHYSGLPIHNKTTHNGRVRLQIPAGNQTASPKRFSIWLGALILLVTMAVLTGRDCHSKQRIYSEIFQTQEPPERLQDIVTWDEHSLFIRGERVMIMSGELHPWRLVPSLYDDIFQKIKALGFNCVSFYVLWALLEASPGNFTAEGVFAYEPFFEAAQRAGIYLIAVSSRSLIIGGSMSLHLSATRTVYKCRGQLWWISRLDATHQGTAENEESRVLGSNRQLCRPNWRHCCKSTNHQRRSRDSLSTRK